MILFKNRINRNKHDKTKKNMNSKKKEKDNYKKLLTIKKN